jgi:hypothetical protein
MKLDMATAIRQLAEQNRSRYSAMKLRDGRRLGDLDSAELEALANLVKVRKRALAEAEAAAMLLR